MQNGVKFVIQNAGNASKCLQHESKGATQSSSMRQSGQRLTTLLPSRHVWITTQRHSHASSNGQPCCMHIRSIRHEKKGTLCCQLDRAEKPATFQIHDKRPDPNLCSRCTACHDTASVSMWHWFLHCPPSGQLHATSDVCAQEALCT